MSNNNNNNKNNNNNNNNSNEQKTKQTRKGVKKKEDTEEKRKTNKQHGMYAINRENLITTVCYSFSTADCFLETEEDLNPSVHPRYCQWNKPNDSGRGSQHADSPTKQDQMAVHTHIAVEKALQSPENNVY